MKPETQWKLAAASVLLGCWLPGGCCIGVGLDWKGGGKSVLIPQVVAGVGLIVVPMLAVAILFAAHLLGYRPADKARERMAEHERRLAPLRCDLSPPRGRNHSLVPASWTPMSRLPEVLPRLAWARAAKGSPAARDGLLPQSSPFNRSGSRTPSTLAMRRRLMSETFR
jgi:hypothetical protein